MIKYINDIKPYSIATLTLLFILFNSFSGCKPKPTPAPAAAMGSLIFHFHTFAGNQEDTDSMQVYINQDNRNMRLYFSNIFISNIRLITSAGDTIAPLPDTVVLKHFDEETYPLGHVPAGNYKTVKFDVGLAAKINHSNPASYPSSEPYSLLNSAWVWPTSMWSGNTTNGYNFVTIKGLIDTSASGKGVPTQPFLYKLGGDNTRTTILMPEQDFTVASGVPFTVHMTIDFGYFLHGLNPKTQNTCNFVSNPTLAATIAKNMIPYDKDGSAMPAMFRYEY